MTPLIGALTIEPTVDLHPQFVNLGLLGIDLHLFLTLRLGEVVARLLRGRLDLDFLGFGIGDVERSLVIFRLPRHHLLLGDQSLGSQSGVGGYHVAQPVAAHRSGSQVLVERRLLAAGGLVAFADLLGVDGSQLGEIDFKTGHLVDRVLDPGAQQLLLDPGDFSAGPHMVARLHQHLEHQPRGDGCDGEVSFLVRQQDAAPRNPRRNRAEHAPGEAGENDHRQRRAQQAHARRDDGNALVELLGGIEPRQRSIAEDAVAGISRRHQSFGHSGPQLPRKAVAPSASYDGLVKKPHPIRQRAV